VNSFNRFVPVLILFVICAIPATANSLVDQLYSLRAYTLADSYWAAGKQFIHLGQKERGAQFQARALQIFPGYVPGQAPQVTASSAAPTPQLPSEQVVLEKNIQGEKVARLQFEKLLRGYLLSDAATMTGALAAQVKIQGQDTSVSAASLADYLAKHPTEAGSPSDLFDTSTMVFTDGANQQITLTIQANPQAPADLASVSFWKPTQTYVFDRDGDNWKLTSVSGK